MFKNLKLRPKLIAAFCMISAIALFIGGIGYKGITDTKNSLHEISDKCLPGVQSLLLLYQAQTEVFSTELAMLNPRMTDIERQAQSDRCAAAHKQIEEAWMIYESLPKTHEEEQLWQQFIPKWERWMQDHQEFHRLSRLEKTDEVWEQMSRHALEVEVVSFTEAERLLLQLVNLNMSMAEQASVLADARAASSINMLTVSIIGGILLALGMGIYMAQMITRPVTDLVKAANTAASGDLTTDIKVNSKDEVGELAAAFNKMVAQMREIILQIIDKSNSVAGSAQQLNSSSQQTAATANETSATMSEISHTVDQVSSSVHEISKVSIAASNHANQGNEGLNRVNAQMQQISLTTGDVAKAIGDLSDKSQEINQIVELITSIAEQTNLLALNAAIEAARAGDQGRGFAVVAEEVRKLAEQSGNAAKEIYQLINSIQGESQRAVENMSVGTREVEAGTLVVQEVGENFKEIIGAVQQLTQQIQEVASASEQMSGGVQNVAASTEEQTAAMEEVSASATALSGMAEELNSLVSKFKV